MACLKEECGIGWNDKVVQVQVSFWKNLQVLKNYMQPTFFNDKNSQNK